MKKLSKKDQKTMDKIYNLFLDLQFKVWLEKEFPPVKIVGDMDTPILIPGQTR